jgi:hypothetical protein
LRKKFERFCFKNRNYGIPNLMLYISLGTALVYVMSMVDDSTTLYNWLCFDRELILQGQIWRLVSYVLCYDAGNIVLTAISLVCYYSLGRSIENTWGTLRFNLFYFTGVILQDIFCMVVGSFFTHVPSTLYADVYFLNLSLFLSFATMYPQSEFLLLYIIPVKAWIFGLLDLCLTFYNVLVYSFAGLFPLSVFPLVALLNYFLFFGKDMVNIFPISWRANARRLFRRKPKAHQPAKTIPFSGAANYQSSVAKAKAPYTHQCTICGRTDVSNPELEFRYCSRCEGYHCFCIDHINNHIHFTE